jgi:hypothetical protein
MRRLPGPATLLLSALSLAAMLAAGCVAEELDPAEDLGTGEEALQACRLTQVYNGVPMIAAQYQQCQTFNGQQYCRWVYAKDEVTVICKTTCTSAKLTCTFSDAAGLHKIDPPDQDPSSESWAPCNTWNTCEPVGPGGP